MNCVSNILSHSDTKDHSDTKGFKESKTFSSLLVELFPTFGTGKNIHS